MSTSADHANEGSRDDGRQSHEPPLLLPKQCHVFVASGTDGQDQATSFGELLDERSGDLRRGGGADDRLKGSVLRRSHRAVTNNNERICDSSFAEVLTGGSRQIGKALDRYDPFTEPRDDRGLEAKPRADLQRVIRLLEFQRLYHFGDQRRLSGNLEVSYGNGEVLVCRAGQFRRNEVGPAHDAESLYHTLIAHALSPDRQDEIIYALALAVVSFSSQHNARAIQSSTKSPASARSRRRPAPTYSFISRSNTITPPCGTE